MTDAVPMHSSHMATAANGQPRIPASFYLLYLLVTIILFNETFLQGSVLVARDLLHYFFPFAVKFHEAVRGTGSLLWDRGLDNGLPVAARLSPVVFYPATWLQAVLPPLSAITLGILIHLPIAAAAMLRLCLRYTDSPIAAWIGGLGYAFGGYMLSMIGGGIYLYGAALLPVGILATHRLVERPSASRAAQLSLILALQVLCGDLQTLCWEVLVIAPCIVACRAEGRGHRVRAVAWGLVSGAIAMGIAACQLIPTAEFARLSTRAGGIPLADAQEWSFPPLRLLEFIVPHLFGGNMPSLTFWLQPLLGEDFQLPWTLAVHVGSVLLLAGLPCLNLTTRDIRRATILWGGLTALFLVLAFGRFAPAHALIHALVPGADAFRYPEKFLVFVSLGLALLGATGLGTFLTGIGTPGTSACLARRVIASCLAVALAALATRLLIAPEIDSRAAAFSAFLSTFSPKADAAGALDATTGALVRACTIASTIACVLLLRHRIRPWILLGSLAALAAVDIISAGLPLKMVASPAVVAKPPALCARLAPVDGVQKPSIWRSNKIIYGSDEWRRFDSVTNRVRDVETLLPNIGTAFCVNEVRGHEAARLAQYQALLDALGKQGKKYMELLGADYLLTLPDEFPKGTFPKSTLVEDLGITIRRHETLPYARLVATAEGAAGGGDAIARVADPGFDYRSRIVIENHPGRVGTRDPAGASRVETLDQGRSTVVTTSNFATFLIVRENFYPGWRAQVDGKTAPLYRADGAFLSLDLPPGEHRVSLVFDPPIQRRANILSVVSLLLAGAIISASHPGVRRRQAGASDDP